MIAITFFSVNQKWQNESGRYNMHSNYIQLFESIPNTLCCLEGSFMDKGIKVARRELTQNSHEVFNFFVYI